jgi:hypothetical protein
LRLLRNLSAWALPAILASSAQALVPASAAAAAPSRVGDGIVDASRLRPYDNAFVVTQTVADGRVIEPGIWTDQLRLRTVEGRQVFVRTQGIAYFDGRVMSSVNIFDPITFAPISNVQNIADGSRERWSFRGLVVEGHLTGAGRDAREAVRNLSIAAPAFDFNCCMRSLLPAAVRLRAGETFTVPGVVADDGDMMEVTFHVIGRERVRAGYRGMVDAWVVQTDVPGGGAIVKFWIIDTAPFLVHMWVSQDRNSPGGHYEQSFDMIG